MVHVGMPGAGRGAVNGHCPETSVPLCVCMCVVASVWLCMSGTKRWHLELIRFLL